MSEHTYPAVGGTEQRLQTLEDSVQNLNNTVFGDRTDPTERPGLLVGHVRMDLEQKRTNEILTEFRSDVRKAVFWLFSLIGTAIAAAVFAAILKK